MIVKTKTQISFSNPGNFRLDIEEAKSGGISDPRNATLIKIFNLINIGERAGSGIPSIYAAWERSGLPAPVLTEQFDPERTTLTLSVGKVTIKSDDKKSDDKKERVKTAIQKQKIIRYLTDRASAATSELTVLPGIKPTRLKTILYEMIADGIVVAEGGNRNRRYRLRS